VDNEPILKARYPSAIHATTVKRWLKSPELVGDWGSKDGLIEGLFEPLLSLVDYQRIQEESKRRTTNPKKQGSYLLSGLVICTNCFASFHTRIQKPRPTLDAPIGSEEYSKKPSILYCNCSNYLKNGSCSNNSTWAYEVLMFIHWYGISVPMMFHEEQQTNNKQGDTGEIESKLNELKARSVRLEELYLATGNQSHLDKVREISLAIDELNSKLGAAIEKSAKQSDFDEITRAFQNYNTLSVAEQNSLLRRLQHYIFIDGKTATLGRSFTNPVFEVVKRSQKYGVYIVRVTSDAAIDKRGIGFFAVGKKGETLFSAGVSTVTELLEKLQAAVEGKIQAFPHFGVYQ
jgi:hypothetical protein